VLLVLLVLLIAGVPVLGSGAGLRHGRRLLLSIAA